MKEQRYLELEILYHLHIPPGAKPAIAHGLFRGQTEEQSRKFRAENFASDAEYEEFRTEYRKRHYPRREPAKKGWLKRQMVRLGLAA